MKFFSVLGLVLAENRHIQYQIDNGVMQRAIDDRYIWQFPTCKDASCGKYGMEKWRLRMFFKLIITRKI